MVGSNPAGGMDICVVLCMLLSKEKRQTPGQSAQRNTKYKERTKKIPAGAWMFVCCECCMLSGRGLCDGPIPRPEESYRLWCVIVCDEMNHNPLHLTWLGKHRLD